MQVEQKDFLFLTAHDFRSPRWASIHFIAQEFAKRGRVRFFSLRYSLLSAGRPDPRHVIAHKANKEETFQGIECFLWKTTVHPINFRRKWLEPFEGLFYRLYVRFAPDILKSWIREATTIVVESGTSVVFFNLIKKLNPAAEVIYLCSDSLASINSSQYVRDVLWQTSGSYNTCVVCSRQMTDEFAPGSRIVFVPHGVDPALASIATTSPYGSGIHGVSVGSMLFDPDFFEVAAKAFPEITFHVIGCGRDRPENWPSNVVVYNEMKFNDTIPYIKHASFGIAPYVGRAVPPSLADTSMKLMQYAFFGLPAVCCKEVVGNYPHRFGYETGDAASIERAIKQAVSSGQSSATIKPLNWIEVADRVLSPSTYADTSL